MTAFALLLLLPPPLLLPLLLPSLPPLLPPLPLPLPPTSAH
jgi:hypothetical protein